MNSENETANKQEKPAGHWRTNKNAAPASKFIVVAIIPNKDKNRIGKFDYEYADGDSRANKCKN